MEATRALKRRLSDVVYRQMTNDARRARAEGTGPEANRERLRNPARPAQSRRLTLRTSHFPDPPLATYLKIDVS